MKKLISLILIAIIHLTFVIGNLSFADAYKLSAYDTIELDIVNHPELKTKQTITPDGQASLTLPPKSGRIRIILPIRRGLIH